MASQSLGLPLWDAVPRGCGRGDAAWRAAALACPGRGSRRPPARPVLAGQQLRRWGPGRVISSPELSRTQGLTSRQGLRGRKGRQRPSFHEHRPAAGSALSGPGCTPKAPLQDRGDGRLREGNCPPLLLGSGDRGPSQVLHVGSHYRGGDRVRKALWVIGKDTGAPGKCHQLKRAPICSCFRLSEPSPAGPLNGEGGPRSRPMRPLREAGAPPPPYASRGGACQPQVPCLQDPDSCCAQLPLAQVQMPRVARQLEEGRKGVFQDVLRASA